MDKQSVDQKFKTYFEQRELKPKDHIWDRLDARITNSEEEAKIKPFPWYRSIAAGIAIIVAASIWWPTSESRTMLAKTSSIDTLPLTTVSNASPDISAKDMTVPHNIEKLKVQQINENTQSHQIDTKELSTITNHERSISDELQYADAIDVVSAPNVSNFVILVEDPSTEFPIKISAKKLLLEAENKALKTQIRSKYKLDPNSLLAEAEAKANQSFLKKFYKNIQDNAETVIVAVSNRNLVK